MDVSYHLWLENEAKGPYTLGQLRAMWKSGQITSENQFTTDAGETWRPLSDLLASLEPPPVPVKIKMQVPQAVILKMESKPMTGNGCLVAISTVLVLITLGLSLVAAIHLIGLIQDGDNEFMKANDCGGAYQFGIGARHFLRHLSH